MGMCRKKIDPTILSIDFGYKSNALLDHKRKISEKCREIELLQIKMGLERDPAKKIKLQENIKAENILCRNITKEYIKIEKIQKRKIKGEESDNEDVFEPKQKDIESLQEKEIELRTKKIEFVDQIKLVYITFKTMETKNIIESLFSEIGPTKISKNIFSQLL